MSTKKHVNAAESVNWKAVGRRIRELRGFNMTQKDFAKLIGVSQSYLSTVEHGNVEVGAEVLLSVSRAFGKSIEWLLTGEGSVNH
jgi:transcriptional regulator with XRE-family HTH domain